MIYGIKERKGFISVTGEVGTGKTLLIYALLRNLPEKIKVVHVTHTGIDFAELLKTIFLDLCEPSAGGEVYLLLHRLHQYLLRKLASGENVVLVIDEAQNLSKDVMEEIRMLSNLETPTAKLLQVLLVGQPELESKLNSNDLRQLRQRIGIRRTIRPLDSEECGKYMDHRLRLVGSSLAVFAPDAVSLIVDYAKGVPRVINIACDNAFLIGFSLGEKRIGPDTVREVISDLEGGATARPGEPAEAGDGAPATPAPPDDFRGPSPEGPVGCGPAQRVEPGPPRPDKARKIEWLNKLLLLVQSKRQRASGLRPPCNRPLP